MTYSSELSEYPESAAHRDRYSRLTLIGFAFHDSRRRVEIPASRERPATLPSGQVVRRGWPVSLAPGEQLLRRVECGAIPLQEPPGGRPQGGEVIRLEHLLEQFHVQGWKTACRLFQFLEAANGGGLLR
jgi:hypothetical protein